MNYYLILRAIPFLLAAQSSMFAINDWLSVIMLGPDCWNFSPKELNIDHQHLAGNDDRYGTYTSSGQRYGVDTELLTDPIAQSSLRYAVSGVGVCT